MSDESGGRRAQDGRDGQPQGGQTRRRGSGTNPGIGDIFSREDTKAELKFGVALFAVLAVGFGVAALLLDALSEPPGLDFFSILVWVIVPVLGAVVGRRSAERLAATPDTLAYATAAVAGIAGSVVFGLITWLFGEITYEVWATIGEIVQVWIAFGIAAGIVGAMMVAVERKV